jgi:hypothetical protein
MNFKEWLNTTESDTLDDLVYSLHKGPNSEGINVIHICLSHKDKTDEKRYDGTPECIARAELRLDKNPTCIDEIGINDKNLRNKKIGSTLYEIALELATQPNLGVMICGALGQSESSPDAYRVWDHFFKNRTDIIATPVQIWNTNQSKVNVTKRGISDRLRNYQINTFTIPIPDDPIEADKHFEQEKEHNKKRSKQDGDELQKNFPAAYQVYQRKLITIPKLQNAGKLIFKYT